jgi:hypothetical protein
MTNIFFKVSNIESNQRRKCHRAKPVFLEESEAFKEQQRQKDRERRKKRKILFENKSPLGTRRLLILPETLVLLYDISFFDWIQY